MKIHSSTNLKRQRRFLRRNPLGVSLVCSGMLLAAVLMGPTDSQAQRKRLSLDELVIEGTIQKPEAFFILPRTNLNFEDLERKEDLKERIIKSVEKAPF